MKRMLAIGTALFLLVSAFPAIAYAAWMPNDVKWVKVSEAYKACCLQAYNAASREIERRAASCKEPWAVVLDVDETALSNIPFQVELAVERKRFNQELWGAWCEKREAKAVAGALDFTRLVKKLGGKVVFITNRRDSLKDATADNLKKEGFEWDALLPRTDERSKEPRREMVRKGLAVPDAGPLKILMIVGDQIPDFIEHGEAKKDEWGGRHIILPNPMYGDWTRK